MSDGPFHHVLCIGNAMVDMLATCDDAFLAQHEIIKGAMNLVDAERSAKLYNAMGPSETMSGGSAGNTAAAIAALGGTVAYIGKVADDQLGTIFGHDIRALGASFNTPPLLGGDPTARCMIFVTPDGERSMNTYLGACTELTEDDIAEETVSDCALTYFEGYLWDPPHAKAAIRKAADLAHKHGRQVAMSLSDPFCVDRYREEFLGLLRDGTVDIVFANETELLSLYQSENFDEALGQLAADCVLATVTRGPEGSVVVKDGERYDIPAFMAAVRRDTTGAGDLYAAGFLHGLATGRSLPDSAALGNFCAGVIIEQMGPRPPQNLAELARSANKL
ncbi:adenosine kinase [Notoacmeibacter ruber]|uniref:Adenosine kinase n=1 Tax=Notoacmeibacter ruber TaxID=2670375 RepID=A0A3L7J8E7_9HYPH|nr:adenosine kinase [Notoacmeibacter ruber]RLQ86896.1 adenosine kinase [Notoacmeibacter ruber]